ncbi:MAG: polysaccharide deacetylase family protein [Oscillospiraceae bacterium]|nr:polysaccharide deacetylase family protein [Oscillospiraceae bacterium]
MKTLSILLLIVALTLAACTTAHAPTAAPRSAPNPAVPTEVPLPAPTPQPTPRQPIVALTFDDGPAPHTERILDVLEQHSGRATFFVVGQRLSTHRDTVMRAFEMGNEIANHTWTHPHMTSLTDEAIINEIQSTSAAIAAITGMSPPIYRPPFGLADERVIGISAELGYAVIKWTVDPMDWRDRDADVIVERIMDQVQDGAVILLHDIHETTAHAVELLVPRLLQEGFQLVTVSELLDGLYDGIEAGTVFGSYDAGRMWG